MTSGFLETNVNPVELVLSKLDRVRTESEQQWNAQCPAHEDARNSLAVSVGEDGRALVRCLANCETGDVLSQLGLELKDLHPSTKPRFIGKPEESRVIQPRHGFYIVTESNPPMSRKAVLALLRVGLKLEGTPLRIVEARVEEFDEGDGRVLIEKED